MNFSYLIHFTREAELKYLSHLDMLRLWQRALRRADLPTAFSQGFNPHEKISMTVPLSVGMTSSAEYLELELGTNLKPAELKQRIEQSLPKGLALREVRLSPYKGSLTAKVALIEYSVILKGVQTDAAGISKKIQSFNDAAEVKFLKTNKKGTKEIDIRPRVKMLELKEKPELTITMKLTAGNQGSIKPEEVIKSMGIEYSALLPHRQAIYFTSQNGEYFTP